jgi:hypothetical protein
MAGGGLSSTSPVTATKGVPYLIAYWDYFSDGSIDPNSHSLQIKLNGDSLFTPNEIYICNHPWPYYGNINGDGFARPFHSGDYFDLIIHAIHANNTESTYTCNLARYVGRLIQLASWTRVPLADSLGTNVKSLYFTMKSTDELIIDGVNYGPNTAVYFDMDKLKVTKTGGAATGATTAALRKAKAKSTPKTVKVTDYFPVKSHSGGEVIVFDEKGKEILRTKVEAGEKINLSKLPAGEYHLRHGHKLIPVTKVGKGGK